MLDYCVAVIIGKKTRKVELGQSTQDYEILSKNLTLVVSRPLGVIKGLRVKEGTVVL